MAGPFAPVFTAVWRSRPQHAVNLAMRTYGTAGAGINVKKVVKTRKGALTLVETGLTVSEVAKIMNNENVGCAMVMNGKKVHGIVTERDILRKVVVKNMDPSKVPIGDIATTKVISVGEDATLNHCMSLMTREGLRHLPVVQDGVMVDVLSIRDLVTAIHDDSKAEIDHLREYIGFQPNIQTGEQPNDKINNA